MKYSVKPGDTLAGIAKKYTLAMEYYIGLANLNNIANPNIIYSGQVIEIPDNWLKPEYRGQGMPTPMIQTAPTAGGSIPGTVNTGGASGTWGTVPTQQAIQTQQGLIFGVKSQTLMIAGVGVILLAALWPSQK